MKMTEEKSFLVQKQPKYYEEMKQLWLTDPVKKSFHCFSSTGLLRSMKWPWRRVHVRAIHQAAPPWVSSWSDGKITLLWKMAVVCGLLFAFAFKL